VVASKIATDAGMALKISFFRLLEMIPEKVEFSPRSDQNRGCSIGRLKKEYIKESQVSKKIKSLQKNYF